MGIVVTESEMQFGDYKKEQVFCIEKSRQYTEKLRGKGIKSCEFLLLRGNKLFFIEAKKSCPKQIAADTEEKKRRKYEQYIQEIVLKMKHSLTLYSNIVLERYSTDGVPEAMKRELLYGGGMIRFGSCLILMHGEGKKLDIF